MPHTYILFGLAIKSDIVLPATPLSTLPPNHTPDVTIEYGVSPLSLENPVIANAFHQAKTDEFLLLVPGVARYHIYAGRHITVTPEPGAGKEDILLFLMGSSMGALLHQRHVLVLHAGAIAAKGGAILFTGPSGIGKSTLTAALHQRGYPFLADDICAISLTGPEPAVICGFPRLKLWEDTMARLRTATEGLHGCLPR